jgi:hypothetical protein
MHLENPRRLIIWNRWREYYVLICKNKMSNPPTLKVYGPDWASSETLGYVSRKAMKSSTIICNNYTNFCFIKKLKRSMKLRPPNPPNLCRNSYSRRGTRTDRVCGHPIRGQDGHRLGRPDPPKNTLLSAQTMGGCPCLDAWIRAWIRA